MSNPPYGGMPPAAAPWPPQGPPPGRGPSRLPLILTAAVAVIAIVVAIASWFRPMPEPEAQASEPQFSEQEIADAKDAVCDAWDNVLYAIQTPASKSSTDETVTFVLGTEIKLAFHASGDFLQSAAEANPATPDSLATAINDLASAYHRATLKQLADATGPEVDAIKNDIRSSEAIVRQECE